MLYGEYNEDIGLRDLLINLNIIQKNNNELIFVYNNIEFENTLVNNYNSDFFKNLNLAIESMNNNNRQMALYINKFKKN